MPRIGQVTTSACLACEGTRLNSRGGPCFACEMKERIVFRSWKPRPHLLLQNNTVKPLHEVVPRLILGKEWWDKTRAEAYASTDYHCGACGVPKQEAKEFQRLEGHEVYRIDYIRGRQTYIETVPLCHYCHSFIHDGRLRILLLRKEVSQEKYDAVMTHGSRILKAAGITKPPAYVGKMAPWKKWRLVLDGKLYPPKYKSYQEWSRHFNQLKED